MSTSISTPECRGQLLCMSESLGRSLPPLSTQAWSTWHLKRAGGNRGSSSRSRTSTFEEWNEPRPGYRFQRNGRAHWALAQRLELCRKERRDIACEQLRLFGGSKVCPAG